MNNRWYAMLLLVIGAFSPLRAEAYIDPGSGSYIVQIAIAALVGSGFALKLLWSRIKGLFRRPRSRSTDDERA